MTVRPEADNGFSEAVSLSHPIHLFTTSLLFNLKIEIVSIGITAVLLSCFLLEPE